VTDIPAEVSARFLSNEKLGDEDRKAILQVAAKATAPFRPDPAAEREKKP
jgi:F-type H+-transporting ATPase subunit alpha